MSEVHEPPLDRFCDLVMKGGITSGIVYPKAIGLLARHYRFRSIGGTSAGAIAAAVTAAAELQRREKGTREGFALLEQLPEQLQAKVPSARMSKLLSLFQPQRRTRRLFSVLMRSLNSKGTYRRVLRIVAALLLAYWQAVVASVVLAGGAAALGSGVFGAVLLSLLALPVLVGRWIYRDITQNVVDNGFGLCNGMTEYDQHEALTPWLHALIQKAAGRGPMDRPLTFGDLWSAPGFPPTWYGERFWTPSIDLRMFTTNLTHGRPYLFPLADWGWLPAEARPDERLYFKPHELARYLPRQVVDWMRLCAKPYVVAPDRRGKDPDEAQADGAMELPLPRDLPVLLAARMSLSFPLLLSAVPLHAIDREAPTGASRFRCCWFSDGGISSNFPMHLFDALVPLWPGFGISLEEHIEGSELVYLPTKYDDGHGERWTRFAESDKSAGRFGGFVSAIFNAMQNWNDNSVSRMPGVRDRVARVRLKKGEGGMNLNMEPQLIDEVARRGVAAAEILMCRFAQARKDGQPAEGWDEHRFVRLNVLLKLLATHAPFLDRALRGDTPYATNFATLLNALNNHDGQGRPKSPPPGYEKPLTH